MSIPKLALFCQNQFPIYFLLIIPPEPVLSAGGFGRVIGIDIDKALPDKSLSIAEGVVRPFQSDSNAECQDDLERCARQKGISLVTPFDELTKEEQRWILNGDTKDEEEAWIHGLWYGVKGFFRWMEARSYKMHVRVMLSRYRSYTLCADCDGTRLKTRGSAF